MKKVATYCRVSIHNNSDQALEKQQERVTEYCEKKGYEVADSFCITGDRATGLAMFLNCIQTAKESGVDTIVMASTNRIVGSVEEMEKVRKVYETSGVALETMDGSHLPFNSTNIIADLVLSSQAESEEPVVYGPSDENVELVFGYDVTSEGLRVNAGEAEVVRFVFDKIQEYTENPPAELVQEVIDEHISRGEEISEEDAARKVSFGRITYFVEEEIKVRWPEQFESLINKREHNRTINHHKDVEHEPLIGIEEWEEVQAKMAERHNDTGPQMGGMTM